MSELMKMPADVPCPGCGARVAAKWDDFRRERTVTCRNGHRVELVDQGKGVSNADRAIRDLERAVKRLGGKLKYRRR